MRLSFLAVVAVTAVRIFAGRPAYAATFAVDTTTDDPAKTACDPAVADDCSLRGALIAANSLAESSTVDLPAGTYELTQIGNCPRHFPGGSTQVLTIVPLCLSAQVTVQGAGAATTIIDGKDNHRVLFVSFGAVAELRGVTLTHGIGEPLPEGGGADGGNIRNLGTLTLTDTVVSHGALPVGFGGAGGLGIYNAGLLTLLRSTVTLNISQIGGGGGGGIYNDGAQHAVLNVIDSVVSNNSIHAIGGGIYSYAGATATVTGSTIAGNSAVNTQGGGIYNDGTLTLIDTTISGNQSGSSGGGISNGQHSVADLNNVTIANNTSGTAGAGRGGGVASFSTTFTLRNTIIAGNFDLASGTQHPDCDAPALNGFNFPLVSAGYNLVGDVAGCGITGDLTGNVTGVDARLGLLVNNIGATPTHALAVDSPALEAGNPAPPGSGGTACAATDQRGFVRPIGARCDIGAFERGGPFAVTQVTPPVGGDIGSVSALVSGNSMVDGATVTLVRTGQPDIVGSAPHVDPGGSALTTTFDLVGKARGAWDVVVTNPDATTQTLAGGFTIEAGRAPDPWVEVVGSVRRTRQSRFSIFYGNRGNVDATAVPLIFGATGEYGLTRVFPITRPPTLPNSPGQGIWDQVRITVAAGTEGEFTNVPLLLPVVPAAFTGILPIVLTLQPTQPDGTLFAQVGTPYLTPTLDPTVVATLVEGARAYSASNFGIPIPADLVPDMSQYVADQLDALVLDGRDALVTFIASSPQVYSLAQLELDLALFGASHAAAQQAIVPRLDPSVLLSQIGQTLLWPLFSPVEAFAQKQGVICCSASVVEGCTHCDPKSDIISPSGPTGGTCNFEALKAYASNPFSNPRPDCSPTESDCNVMANHRVITLSNGAKVCHADGCDQSKSDGYQNTSHCRDFPINPKKSNDPNDKAGSLGTADAQFVRGDTPFTYVIHFENLDTATAPAATVVVTDPLDTAHLDLDTFSLGPISFGDFTLVPSPGQIGFTGSVDLRPAQNIVVTVDATLDKATGIVTWRFDSIDPATGQSTDDPAVGFLPPNVTPPAGEGSVSFSVHPKAGVASAVAICNQASIVFDQNDPLATPNWCNTIDVTPPESSVQALAETQAALTFPVQWAGTDAGAGIATYSVYVSENGAPYAPLVTTTDASTMFAGELGKVYAFYSVARDAVGNLEPAPPTPDALTAVGGSPGPHDLAITAIKVPARVVLTTKKPSLTKAIKVLVQNRGPNPETIPDAAALANLVQVSITSSGVCAAPTAVLHAGAPQKKLPATLKKKGKLTLRFDATFDCANDPAKGEGHEDYAVSARVHANALGEIDAHGADDDCPRQVAPPGVHDPFPDGKLVDKGCGAKKKDKTLGDPVTVDVVDKRGR